ncbi:MAG: ATPase domain-containing protein [Candidatus Altiarchaeota archaeon]
MAGRISTGIKGIDSMLEGGIEDGSVILVSGVSGTGKTILALQYLQQGLSEGETVLYVTFKESEESLKRTIKTMGWKLSDSDRKFRVLEISPEEIPDLIQSDCKIILQVLEAHKPKRVVIDAITTFSLYSEGLELRQSIFKLYNLMRSGDHTTLLLSDLDRRRQEETTHEFIEPYVDGIIALYSLVRTDARYKAIEVLKMRRTDHHTKRVWYKIKDGFEVDYRPYTTIW